MSTFKIQIHAAVVFALIATFRKKSLVILTSSVAAKFDDCKL